MLQYTLRRLMLVPPTFFLISLVIFAVLNVAPPAPTVGCGLCQWLPFESTVVLPVTSNLVDVALPIPCAATLAGAQVDAQWTVWRVGQAPCPLAPNFVLSDIQRLGLQ